MGKVENKLVLHAAIDKEQATQIENLNSMDGRVKKALTHLTELQSFVEKRFEGVQNSMTVSINRIESKVNSIQYVEDVVKKNSIEISKLSQ